jgi:hypothetical protein
MLSASAFDLAAWQKGGTNAVLHVAGCLSELNCHCPPSCSHESCGGGCGLVGTVPTKSAALAGASSLKQQLTAASEVSDLQTG